MVRTVELDEACLGNVAGEISAGCYANGTVLATVKYEGRNRNSAQKMAHIGIAQPLEQALESSGARRGPEQACPPGSRLRVGTQAGRERLDGGGPAPARDELLQPG